MTLRRLICISDLFYVLHDIRVSCTSKTKIILRVFGKYLLFHCCWLEMVSDVVFMVNFLSPQMQILEKFLFRSYGPNSSWSIKQLNSWIRNASKRIERLFQFLTYRSTSKRKTNILCVGGQHASSPKTWLELRVESSRLPDRLIGI